MIILTRQLPVAKHIPATHDGRVTWSCFRRDMFSF